VSDSDLPHAIEDVEHVLLPMRDGIHLAARLWLPADAGARPAPAILEYIPYRKRDGTRLRDEPMHRWFAGHGFAAVRVDLRGCGDSEGLLEDEYTLQEQEDALDTLAWIAAQPWCDGRVGMLGKSWGGFSALQVAALRPPALRAVIAVCATDDRYADDAHYMGGCLLNENLLWGSMLMALCAQPPDPLLVGPSWRQTWRQRLASVPAFPALWLRHPLRDHYWRHGSIRDDYAAVQVPVWAISGWADGYSNAVLRLLAGLPGRRWGMVGPWAHLYPHEAVPGPAAGFLQEALRFFDRWLRDVDNGWEARPLLRAYLQESARPEPGWPDRPGRWVAEDAWPSPRLAPVVFRLRPGVLVPDGEGAEPAPAAELAIATPPSVGASAGSWCAFGLDGEGPSDQRADDAAALCFDSAPLPARLEILGAPELDLVVTADRPQAQLVVRLCEVFPDGTSARVSYALRNLAHDDTHTRVRPLVPGEGVRVSLRLNDVAHAFAPGNRLRLALATASWPMVWPAPAAVTLVLKAAACELRLPERPPARADDRLPPLPPPRSGPRPSFTDIHAGGVTRRTRYDAATGTTVHETILDLEPDGTPSLTRLDDIALAVGHGLRETFAIDDEDPLSAQAEIEHRTLSCRDDYRTSVRLRVVMRADAANFIVDVDLAAAEGDTTVVHRRWREQVPRG